MQEVLEFDRAVYDVVIIGAGPAGLATAARLREHTPSALFTDEEHQRYHWIRKHSGRMSVKNRKNGVTTAAQKDRQPSHGLSILVVDSSGPRWMTRWNKLFEVYGISHLRSPMFFHIDPSDRDSLLAFAYEKGREKELEELRGCVGKELSKHRKKQNRYRSNTSRTTEPIIDERDRNDYFTPSQSLFSHHCACVAAKYDLDETMIRHADVQDIQYSWRPSMTDAHKIFTISTKTSKLYARTVVLAIGPANIPQIPLNGINLDSPGQCHSMYIDRVPHRSVTSKIKTGQLTSILIVGGGLTSAQLADQAIRRGVSKVWLLMRGQVKIKYFDFDLEWAGKFRNAEKAAFWSADSDEERLEYINKARNGGSVSPKFHNIIKSHMASERLILQTETTLTSANYSTTEMRWTVTTNSLAEMPQFDYIYWATGVKTDFEQVQCLHTMNTHYPISGQGGLPCITNDLMWADEVPLYMTGKLAMLRLGPSAPNLEGCRVGAERIAWSINERMGQQLFSDADEFPLGLGSRYAALSEA